MDRDDVGRPLLCLIVVFALAVPSTAAAQRGGADRRWRSHWPRFGAADAALTIGASAGSAVVLAVPARTSPSWTDTLPLDAEIRDALRSPDRGTLLHVSDALFVAMLVYPIAVDALLLAGAVHQQSDVLSQMLLIDFEALSLGMLVSVITERLVGRERPYVHVCRDGCVSDHEQRFASFVGGHALMTFLSAGLTCVHGLHHPWLYGGIAGSATACAAGLGLATAVSVMRISADQHWASDIAIGGAIGAFIGWIVPILFHYQPAPRRPLPMVAAPRLGGDELGLEVAGSI